MLSIFLIALSLAMDAFAVSVSTGISLPKAKFRHGLILGAYFGGFQFLMPLIGWKLGQSVSTYVGNIGGYIAFVLLVFIGARMIYGSFHYCDEETPPTTAQLFSFKRLFFLAIATSIDALTVGISMSFMPINILLSATIIGIVAFIMSVIGCMLGKKVGCMFQKHAELAGGIILILIGIKSLLETIL